MEKIYLFDENIKLWYIPFQTTNKNIVREEQQRIIRNFLATEGEELVYEKRRPLLKNSSQYISISHTQKSIVVALSLQPIGVDIENKYRDKKLILHKYMTKNELNTFQHDWQHALIWSAKEAIFKLSEQQYPGLLWIEIENIDTEKEQGCISAIADSKKYKVQYFTIKNEYVVFASNDSRSA